MHAYFNFCQILILLSLFIIKTEYHLYLTHPVSESGLYYHCLYYKVLDNIIEYDKKDKNFQSPYEFIPYCIRPFAEKKEDLNGSILSQITFEELK